MCVRPILEYDVLLKCFFYLLANNKRPCTCWILQVPERGDGLVYANDICLHSIANDAEENRGPIIFHILDPTSTHQLTLVLKISVKCYWLPGIFNF